MTQTSQTTRRTRRARTTDVAELGDRSDEETELQPGFDPERSPLTLLFGALVHWAPVWIPLILLAQIGILGLKPARAQSRYLSKAESQLQIRYQRLLERQTSLERLLQAQSDPMYQERERKLWLAPR